MTKNIILCDLDGTLADITHRRHFIEKREECGRCKGTGLLSNNPGLCSDCKGIGAVETKADWPAFFKACVDDTPLQTTIAVINALIDGEDFFTGIGMELWIVSGRSDEVFDETVRWINDHVGAFNNLIMRKKGDYTPDDVLKKSWLDNGTIPKDRVFCVFEDRDRVVQMWRNEGLICYQVANGDF